MRPRFLPFMLLHLAACFGGGISGRPETAEKWFKRAEQGLEVADLDEAHDSVKKALSLVPDDQEVRLLAARVALARLDYAEVIRLLEGLESTEARGLRGRALWYRGDLDAAADQLDAMLNDPEVVDTWAKSISRLARSGHGRTPFAVSGGLLAAVEMPHVSPAAPFFVVPVEIDGESALAMISTGNAEVVLDSTTRHDPSWVSLRFGERLEVRDVPAMVEDLSGLSKQVGAPIKALLGVNLLRHLNVTLDYLGRQFVVRSFVPPLPPESTRVDLFYLKGGGMVLASGLGTDKATKASLLVDTSMVFPLALDQAGWAKAGVEFGSLKPVEGDPEKKLRQGQVSLLRVGAFEVPQVPAVFGPSIAEVEKRLNVNIDGVVGASLLANFRVTLADSGRVMWIEDQGLLRQRKEPAPVSQEPSKSAPETKAPSK